MKNFIQILILCATLNTVFAQSKSPVTVEAQWTEQRVNPVGIDVK